MALLVRLGAEPLGGLFAEGVDVDVAAHHASIEKVEAGFEVDVRIKDMIDQEIFVFLGGAKALRAPFLGKIDGMKELFFFGGPLISIEDFDLLSLISDDAGVEATFVVE